MNNDLVVRTKLARYLILRDNAAGLKKQMEDVKEELKPYLDKARENAAGSKVLDLDTPLNAAGKDYTAVQYTRKVRQYFNEEAVKEWFDSVSEEDYTDTHRTIRTLLTKNLQEELWELFVQDLITEETMNTFTGEVISWAFNPIAD